MRLGLGLGIARTRKIGGLFPAAKTIISEIESRKGSAMTSAQRKAIDTFIRAETAAGRWGTVHKSFFLPGWNNSSANAYNWITNGVGTFANTDANSFANGYFVGNDSNQRFFYDISPSGAGLIAGSASAWQILLEKPPSNKPTGLMVRTGTRSIGFGFGGTPSATMQWAAGNTAGSFSSTDATQTGIYVTAETATNSRYVRVRRSAGVISIATNATDITGTTYDTELMVAMCGRNGTGTSGIYAHAAAKLGGYGIGLGMTTTQADEFTANLKTLWETLFGLTLA